jgi:uncharacterized membrane protein YkvA (DUF1232 family)
MSGFIESWKKRREQLKTEVYALYLAYKDQRTPLVARVFAGVVVAYAFSPIDLIPDFIPVIGYLDDLVLVPLGIFLALKMIPPEVMRDCRLQSAEVMAHAKPVSRAAAVVIVLVWVILAALAALEVWRLARG